jgi:hypothetical protein
MMKLCAGSVFFLAACLWSGLATPVTSLMWSGWNERNAVRVTGKIRLPVFKVGRQQVCIYWGETPAGSPHD